MSKYALDNASLLKQLAESRKYRSIIERICAATQVEQAIVWGIGSRESHWGLLLKPAGPSGTGDWTPRKGHMPPDKLGWGRGLMQIDYNAHEFAKTGNWRDAEANIAYAIRSVLLPNIGYLKRKFPHLDDDAITRGAIAGYNCGPGIVARVLLAGGGNVDKFTAHGNYSADVIDLGKWFNQRGAWAA